MGANSFFLATIYCQRNPVFALPGAAESDPLPEGEVTLERIVAGFISDSLAMAPGLGESGETLSLEPNAHSDTKYLKSGSQALYKPIQRLIIFIFKSGRISNRSTLSFGGKT